MKFALEIKRDRKSVKNKAESTSWAPQWLSRMRKRKKTAYEKDQLSAWAETHNPLRNLSIERANRIYDSARMGAYAELQWLYQEIEAVDSTLFTCVERRSSALTETDYTIKAVDADKARGYDQSLAEDQQGFLKLAFADAENGNLNEAIEHLGLGFFRGFAHVKPLYSNGHTTLEGFDLLDNWNFCRDIHTGSWYWNPQATMTIGSQNLEQIPRGELVSLTRNRHVDYPALNIFIRTALGEKKYGQFIERYGVPPVIITMPPDIDKNTEDAYLTAAEMVAAGGSGALPNGSVANYATDARGTNPFESFFQHQQEQIVLMATGGILTSLSSPTGIGSGASDAHSETWRTVIRRDCKLITTPINRVVVDALLEAAFPGKPKLAYFDFADPSPSASQVFDNAVKAKGAGYRVKQNDLEEKTGYTLEPDPHAAAPGMAGFGQNQQFGGYNANAIANKLPKVAGSVIASHCNSHGDKISNKGDAQNPEASERLSEPILSISQNPINEALRVIAAGGTQAEAMAAYDAAAAAVLTPEKIAEGADEIATILEQAVQEEQDKKHE